MGAAESISVRRSMLGEWACDWYGRHERVLTRERALVPIRVGGRTYLLTAREAEDAVARTHDELFRSFESRPCWGVDERGRPSMVAVRGLAARRLGDRIRDELRARGTQRFVTEELGADDEGGSAPSVSPTDGIETFLSLRQALAAESPTTRAAVLRRAVDGSAVETAAFLGIQPAAVRQRVARFMRRNEELVSAA